MPIVITHTKPKPHMYIVMSCLLQAHKHAYLHARAKALTTDQTHEFQHSMHVNKARSHKITLLHQSLCLKFFSPAILQGTQTTCASETIVFTVQSGQKMTIGTNYTVSFTLTNPAVNNEANSITVNTATTSLLSTTQTIVFNISEVNSNGVLFPYTPLLGVTNGKNFLKTVIPFEVRRQDDIIDTPGAPNIITFQMQTNIAFLKTNIITISGFQLPDGLYPLADLTNNATLIFGTTAPITSGKMFLTVNKTMEENLIYTFSMSFFVSLCSFCVYLCLYVIGCAGSFCICMCIYVVGCGGSFCICMCIYICRGLWW
jgi:hypothetical protein